MNCKNPFELLRLKGQKNLPVGARSHIYVPCGKCLYCRTQRRAEWVLRMSHERTHWPSACFVTLTYSEANLPTGGTLNKPDLQKFFKRLRKSKRKIKYFANGEYGDSTNRPHYHAIIYGVDVSEAKTIQQHWPHGHTYTGCAEPDSMRYVAQYIDKKIYGKAADKHYDGRTPEFQTCSQGLGLGWLLNNADDITEHHNIAIGSGERRIPRYYQKKLDELGHTNSMWHSEEKQRKAIYEADNNLQASGYKDGKLLYEYDMETRRDIIMSHKKSGEQMDKNLRAQAKIKSQQKDRKI